MPKKILFITGHEFLYDPKNGGQKASLRNYRLIQNIFGAENVFLCMFSNYEYKSLTNNEKIFPTHRNNFELFINTITLRNVCNNKIMRQTIKYIKNIAIDYIFADSSTIGYLISKLKINTPVIYFFHNIEQNYARNKFKYEGKKYIVAYWSYMINEKIAVKNSDIIVMLNERDKNEMLRLYKRNVDYLLPITFEDKLDRTKIQKNDNEKIILLFVGSLFGANYMGIKWFIDNVMVHMPSKQYILKIVGKNFETKRKELSGSNIEVIGTVDDLSPYYYEANFVVLPIFYGDGMKVKTAEALMYGKEIFATDEALTGYEINNVKGIYRCNSSTEFIDSIKKASLHISALKYSENIHTLFNEKYDTQIITEKFKCFIDEHL